MFSFRESNNEANKNATPQNQKKKSNILKGKDGSAELNDDQMGSRTTTPIVKRNLQIHISETDEQIQQREIGGDNENDREKDDGQQIERGSDKGKDVLNDTIKFRDSGNYKISPNTTPGKQKEPKKKQS